MIARIIIIFKRTGKRLREESPLTFLCRIIKFLIINSIMLWDYLSTKIIKLTARKQYVIKEILGSKMYLNLKDDEGISYELLKTGIREPYITKAIQKQIKEGDIIVDIGANIGYYALLEARLVGEEGRIYAVEPVSKNIELLKRNIALNSYANIEVSQLAIGSENKMDFIYISDKCNRSSMTKNQLLISKVVGREPVQVMTLDKFLENKPYPNLVRMDVEGYEVEIIKGMRDIFSSNKPLKLLIEVHPCILEDRIKDFLLTLKNAGFEIKVMTHDVCSVIWRQPKFVRRIIDILTAKTEIPCGYLNFTIDDLLNDKLLLEGRRPCLEVLFERK